MHAAVRNFVGGIRTRAAMNFDLAEFYATGIEHDVAVRSLPPLAGTSAASARVAIELSLSKRDAIGRTIVRVLPVAMTVSTRDRSSLISAVAFGALRKP